MVLTTSTFRRLAVAIIVNNIFTSVSFVFIQLIPDVSARYYPGESSPCLLGIALRYSSLAGLFIHHTFIIKSIIISINIVVMY